MKDEVLSQMHNSITSGHLGQKKTKEKLAQRFFWFEMKEDISIWISKCDVCEAIKPPVKHARAPLGSMLKDQTAATCAYFILDEVICRYGCPLSLHSDQGRNFESEIFTELCFLPEIRKTRTSVRNPKGNGQIERFNRSLLAMIKSYLCGEQTDWDLNLGCLAGAYRSTPNESTGLTPNLLMLGREIRLPLEVTLGTSQCVSNDLLTPGELVHNSKGRLEKAHIVARKHLANNAKRRKNYYDNKVNLVTYQIFDKVWYLHGTRKEGISPKLQPLYMGPCLITRKLNDINYKIQLDGTGNCEVVNHDKLKPYRGENIPKWMRKVEHKKI
ncbi:unnamed protein product [Mytilus coruscus]|uniref:Integrase catalytic domain-containing protein n=1 Tax=Mytilus coruscus TaxID=42192 RepID=A0A6J8AAX3_MYTCO|nr:unnamed protein product [Mytilus coruscus]